MQSARTTPAILSAADSDLLLQYSMDLHIEALLHFDSVRNKMNQRVRHLKKLIPPGRYLIAKVQPDENFIPAMYELSDLMISIIYYGHVPKSEYAATAASIYAIAKFHVFVTREKSLARRLLKISHAFYSALAEKNPHSTVNPKAGSLLRQYLQADGHSVTRISIKTYIFTLKNLLLENSTRPPSTATLNKKIELTVNLAFLIRCKAKLQDETAKAVQLHRKAITYLTELKTSSFNAHCELIINYIALSNKYLDNLKLNIKYLIKAGNRMDTSEPTLIQAYFYLCAAHAALEVPDDDPLDFHNKAKIIIDNYFKSDVNQFAYCCRHLLVKISILQVQENFDIENFQRVLQLAVILKISQPGINLQLNNYIRRVLSKNLSYSHLNGRMQISSQQKPDKLAPILKFKYIFASHLNQDNIAMLDAFSCAFKIYKERLARPPVSGLNGFFNKPPTIPPKPVAVDDSPAESAELIHAIDTPSRCCKIM
jgi:hypothetical protein